MECERTREFCKGLQKCNAMVYPIVGNKYAPAGWPDRLILHSLWGGLIEFKDVDTVVQPHQRIILRDACLRNPYFAFIVRFTESDDKSIIECPTTNLYWEFDNKPLTLMKELNRQKWGLENANDIPFLTMEQQRQITLSGVNEFMRAYKLANVDSTQKPPCVCKNCGYQWECGTLPPDCPNCNASLV